MSHDNLNKSQITQQCFSILNRGIDRDFAMPGHWVNSSLNRNTHAHAHLHMDIYIYFLIVLYIDLRNAWTYPSCFVCQRVATALLTNAKHESWSVDVYATIYLSVVHSSLWLKALGTYNHVIILLVPYNPINKQPAHNRQYTIPL